MDMSKDLTQGLAQTQQFHRQYGANALLPEISWTEVFDHSSLAPEQVQALEVLYQSAVPLALQVFEELNFDVFTPAAYKPQGLGLFDRLAEQEQALLARLQAESKHLPTAVHHQIWSMLLRGGAVLVFKAWLGKVKTGLNQIDTTQFDELSDLLFIKTSPFELAGYLDVDINSKQDHIFLMQGQDVYLDRFNSLETAALFAAFLSLRDDHVAAYLKSKGYVTDEQIEELQCALNPLFCTDLNPKQNYVV